MSETHDLLGWVLWDTEENGPFRPVLGRGWRARRKPVVVYQTESLARTYATHNGCSVRPVFLGDRP